MDEAEIEVVDQVADAVEEEVEQVEGETPNAEAAEAGTDSEADEVVITIGEESPPSIEEEASQAPQWVKDLRKDHRELQRKNRELEQRLQSAAPAETAVVLGEKPTLASCDYDEDRFDRDLTAWHERKRAADDQAASKKKDQDAAQAAWKARQDAYSKQKSELKLKDADEFEAIAKDSLSVVQQGIILQGAANAALVTQALARNLPKLKELASIKDPVQFAFAVAKLETQLKVTPRKAAPVPERDVRGNARVSGVVDSELERLRAEADKSGDRTKVAAYMRTQNAKRK